LPKRRQHLLRIRFTGKRPTAEFLERGYFALALFEQLLVDRALRLGVAVLRVGGLSSNGTDMSCTAYPFICRVQKYVEYAASRRQ
jgi:hypothetical protein